MDTGENAKVGFYNSSVRSRLTRMNYQEKLWKQDTHALVALLSEVCGVRMPKLSFSNRQRLGEYNPANKTIRVSRWAYVRTVVHEFAHYLDHVENGRSWGRQANDKEWHSQGFYYKLRKLVRLCGGEYPWHSEYRQIARWAKQDQALPPDREKEGER
jgi:hypothetical protein